MKQRQRRCTVKLVSCRCPRCDFPVAPAAFGLIRNMEAEQRRNEVFLGGCEGGDGIRWGCNRCLWTGRRARYRLFRNDPPSRAIGQWATGWNDQFDADRRT